MEGRYIATLVLHAIGDTIGFKNGDWEFFAATEGHNVTLEKLYEFISLGGVANVSLKDWRVSDDTIMHIAIASAICKWKGSDIKQLEKLTVEHVIGAVDQMIIDATTGKNRYIGNAVKTQGLSLKNGLDWKSQPFNSHGGGNGCAMRTSCIGLAFCHDRDALTRYAISSSKMTHNNPIGWLGGLSVALFVAYAIGGVPIEQWVPTLLKDIRCDQVRSNVTDTTENSDESKAYNEYIFNWKTYYEMRFKDGHATHTKSHTNLLQRLIFYNKIFRDPRAKMGLSGYSAVIVAYDCVLDAGDKWETLVFYSMINDFDSDTIGAIAGSLYGALYGMDNVPVNNLMYLEQRDMLMTLGKQLYSGYGKPYPANKRT
jgi:ADP-ribosylarginine hydrolase